MLTANRIWSNKMQQTRSIRHRRKMALNGLVLVWVAVLVLGGCSLKQTAVNLAGDAIFGGSRAYASDDDPDFIREALPFGIKVSEGLLEESPVHRGLLASVAKGYAVYAYLLQDQADRTEAADLVRAKALRGRAHRFYLRSREHALRGLRIDSRSAELFRQVANRAPPGRPEKMCPSFIGRPFPGPARVRSFGSGGVGGHP